MHTALLGSLCICLAAAPALADNGLAKKAQRCFEDPSCPAEEARSLYLKADDAGDPDVNCFYFYEGIGVERDLPRAFKCFGRAVKREAPKCEGGGSPSMERIMYATMLLDGQGTTAAPQQVPAVLQGCFEDASVSGLEELAQKRTSGAEQREKPLDFCRDIGGTTISMQQCAAVDDSKAQMAVFLQEKKVLAPFDADTRALFAKAQAAWNDFVDKSADFYSDQYRGGTIRGQIAVGYIAEKKSVRAKALAKLGQYTPDEQLTEQAFAAADKMLNGNYKKAMATAGDKEAKDQLKQAQRAWITYRDAEVAFYRAAFGPKFGADKVELDIRTRLTQDRAHDLRPRHSK